MIYRWLSQYSGCSTFEALCCAMLSQYNLLGLVIVFIVSIRFIIVILEDCSHTFSSIESSPNQYSYTANVTISSSPRYPFPTECQWTLGVCTDYSVMSLLAWCAKWENCDIDEILFVNCRNPVELLKFVNLYRGLERESINK